MSAPTSILSRKVANTQLTGGDATTGPRHDQRTEKPPNWNQLADAVQRIAVNNQTFLNIQEAAEFTRLSVSTLNRRKDAGKIPICGGGGDRVIFHRDSLVMFMIQEKITKTPKSEKSRSKRLKKVASANGGKRRGEREHSDARDDAV